MIHDTELPEFENGAPCKFGTTINTKRSKYTDQNNTTSKIVKGLSDPLFASKLDKMEAEQNYSGMAY